MKKVKKAQTSNIVKQYQAGGVLKKTEKAPSLKGAFIDVQKRTLDKKKTPISKNKK
jgi:hypothetical protein